MNLDDFKNIESFVVLSDNNLPSMLSGKPHYDRKGPIVFETYLSEASLIDAYARLKNANKSGKATIAKLVFMSDEEIAEAFKS